MDCPFCGAPAVSFVVPAVLEQYAPGAGSVAALCTDCLRTFAEEAGDVDPDFGPVGDFFPGGEAGVAIALALGKLDSLALERADIVALCEHAERAGGDVLLTLDRLAVSDATPHFDIERRREQLAQLLP